MRYPDRRSAGARFPRRVISRHDGIYDAASAPRVACSVRLFSAVLIIVELYSNESTIDDHGMLTHTSIDSTRAFGRPRHQSGTHRGRAPAKIVRAPAKITGLIVFHLGCQKNWYFGEFLVLKIEKDQIATLCSMEAAVDG